jgi:uncharacterized protein (TIGR02145 family)
MKKTVLNTLILATLFFASIANAQVGVGVPAGDIHPSAELEVKSTTKGFLPPRMTKVERDAILTPAAGLLIYQTDGDVTNPAGLYFYDGTAWTNGLGVTGAVGSAGATGAAGKDGNVEFQNFKVSTTGDTLYLTKGNYVVIPGISLLNLPTSGFGPALVDIDGNSYKTVYIGKQQWMAENLKVTKYNNGNIIPNVQDNTDWSNLTTDAWSTINNDLSNNTRFGKLYNWFAVSAITNNVCPTGWHVPTNAEWDILINYLGGNEVAGSKMKQVGTSNWNSPNDISTNSSLFTALAGAARYSDGNFGAIGHDGNFWSSTENDTSNSWLVYFNQSAIAGKSDQSKKWGLSVRCLRD